MLGFPALSGTADVSQGGTGLPSVQANGLLLGNGTSPLGVLAPGSAGQVLTINANGAPEYITPQGGGTGTTVNAGRFSFQNLSGGTIGSMVVFIPNTAITATSVITATVELDPLHSASGVEYAVNIPANSRQPGVGFSLVVHRDTPSGSASFVNNEGCTLNYMIVG